MTKALYIYMKSVERNQAQMQNTCKSCQKHNKQYFRYPVSKILQKCFADYMMFALRAMFMAVM